MAVDSVVSDDAPVGEDVPTGLWHDIYVEQASKVYPHGATLVCARCGQSLPLTVGQLADVMEHRWPKHCGVDMRIGDRVEEDALCHA